MLSGKRKASAPSGFRDERDVERSAVVYGELKDKRSPQREELKEKRAEGLDFSSTALISWNRFDLRDGPSPVSSCLHGKHDIFR